MLVWWCKYSYLLNYQYVSCYLHFKEWRRTSSHTVYQLVTQNFDLVKIKVWWILLKNTTCWFYKNLWESYWPGPNHANIVLHVNLLKAFLFCNPSSLCTFHLRQWCSWQLLTNENKHELCLTQLTGEKCKVRVDGLKILF